MRQRITPNPEERLFEAYMSFEGGHNSEIANDKLRDDEFVVMENTDLSNRGSARRRTGREMFLAGLVGNPQGHFLFYELNTADPYHLFAAGGKLFYKNGSSVTEIPILDSETGVAWTTTLKITAKPTTNGNITINLKGTAFVVPVLSSMTIEDVATKIYNTEFDGFVVKRIGKDTVRFTAEEVGNYAGAPTFSPASTGVTATFAGTVSGTNASNLTFQTTRDVEAVQYGTALYIATGTKLVEVTHDDNVWKAQTVMPYTPSMQEVIFIGTNSLAEDPTAFVQDTESPNLQMAGIAPSTKSSAVNTDTRFNAYISKPTSITSVEYKWEYRKTGSTEIVNGVAEVVSIKITASATSNGNVLITLDGVPYSVAVTSGMNATAVAGAIRAKEFINWTTGGTGDTVTITCNSKGARTPSTYNPSATGAAGTLTIPTKGENGNSTWTLGQDWKADIQGKTFILNVDDAGSYDIQAWVRDSADPTNVNNTTLSGYKIDSVMDRKNILQSSEGIRTCNRIMLHWDRILLYGDTINPFLMYVSDLQNPAYIPTNNIISYDTGKLEPINSVLRFQDYLVIMTITTTQTLLGKDPSSYERYLIHDTIGCIAPKSAVVVGNQIIHMSYTGISALRPNPYRVEVMNVKRLDVQIHSEILARINQTNAAAIFYDNQYWICFPDDKVIYRFYYEQSVWVRDKSNRLDIKQFTAHGGKAYNLTKTGNVYTHESDVWKDVDDVYDMNVNAKMYSLGYDFNNKKLRRMYVIARHFSEDVPLYVEVWSDSALIVTPEEGHVEISEDGEHTTWVTTTTPNMHFYSGTVLGSWILGVNPLGDVQISVQKVNLQGKCRRVRVNFRHSEDSPCEIYGFGFEYKLKKI